MTATRSNETKLNETKRNTKEKEANKMEDTKTFQTIRITGVAHQEGTEESTTLWVGRKIGSKQKDLQLSRELPTVSSYELQMFLGNEANEAMYKEVAQVLSDEYERYVRTVKCQRLEVGDFIELTVPREPSDFIPWLLKLLTSPAQRAKRLLSTSSVRAMRMSSEYKTALAFAIPAEKQEAFKRISDEFFGLATAQDATCALERVKVRDVFVTRLMTIVARMPEGNAHTSVLMAAVESISKLSSTALNDENAI